MIWGSISGAMMRAEIGRAALNRPRTIARAASVPRVTAISAAGMPTFKVLKKALK